MRIWYVGGGEFGANQVQGAGKGMVVIRLKGPRATRRLGRRLGAALTPGDRLDLRGPLGSGKTTLAQGALEACLGPGVYRSPSFTLIHAYPQGVVHADLYRLDPAQAVAWVAELEEAGDRVMVEWGDRLPRGALGDCLEVHLRGRRGRRAFFRPRGAAGWATLGRALGDWSRVRLGRRMRSR